MSGLQVSSFHLSTAATAHQDLHRNNTLNELASESGIADALLLEELLRYDIKPGLIRALEVSPLFFMAWADGDMDVGEDQFIHDHLRRLELPITGASYRQVCHWFNVPPAQEYLAAWQIYMRGKLLTLSPADRKATHHELLRLVKNLAHCSGGFLGLGPRISSAEHTMLRTIEKVFVENP